MNVQGAIFDLDGTLVDSLGDLAGATNEMLRNNGHPEHPVSAFRHFIGNGAWKLVERALPPEVAADADLCAARVEEYNAIYDRRWAEDTHPYPRINEVLSKCVLSGIKLGILSNKPHHFTTEFAKEFFPNTPWVSVIGQREGIAKKPDPVGALEIAKTMNLAPEQIAFIGDSGVDMETAKSAGMLALGAAWGFRSKEELLESGADYLIDEPIGVLEYLGG